ncbi:CAZyme family AA7 [Paecilomyces variotii]|nr:CAZyme family AA7 [Paecilomyces variotii]
MIARSFPGLLSVALTLNAFTVAYDITALLSELSPSTEVFYPSDANWTDSIQRWTTYDEPTFVAALKPASVEDLQTIVKFSAINNVPFLASGRGHGYSTSFGALENGIKVDLGFFNKTTVDASANRMTVGGSVAFEDLMPVLFEAGKEIQTGSCPCVGMLGATLGGGVGRYQGLHGLIIDALKSVNLVTASGDLITVSETENSDLFWGIRGAGFNYGIITEATYEVYDLTNGGVVVNADFLFPASSNETFFKALTSFGTLPPALSLYTLVVRNTTINETVILLNAVYPGPEHEALNLIQPFMDIPYIEKNISLVSWDMVDSSAGFGLGSMFCVDGQMHDMYSVGVKTLDLQTHLDYFNNLTAFYENYPSASGSAWEIEFFPIQAIEAVPDFLTAYPHRAIRAQEMFSFNLTDLSAEEGVNEFANQAVKAFNATSGFDDFHVYVSYAHGTESLSDMYGAEKLPRLLRLKETWDPKNLFRFNNPLVQ